MPSNSHSYDLKSLPRFIFTNKYTKKLNAYSLQRMIHLFLTYELKGKHDQKANISYNQLCITIIMY
jgi:hypothetical protein